MRRGKRTANLIWGNPASVLVGDFLFSRAFELMVEDGSLKVLQHPQPRLRGDCRGRGRAADRPAPDRHRRRSLSRHHQRQDRGAVRCRLPRPPVVAEAGEDAELALESYGRNLGIAFQLTDDVDRLCVGCGDHGQGRRRRLPRRQDDAAGDPGLRPRQRRRARLLARGDRRRARVRRRFGEAIALLRSPTRSTTRSSARGITAAGRSTRLPSFPSSKAKARPGRGRRVRRRPRRTERPLIRRPPSAPSDAHKAFQPT